MPKLTWKERVQIICIHWFGYALAFILRGPAGVRSLHRELRDFERMTNAQRYAHMLDQRDAINKRLKDL